MSGITNSELHVCNGIDFAHFVCKLTLPYPSSPYPSSPYPSSPYPSSPYPSSPYPSSPYPSSPYPSSPYPSSPSSLIVYYQLEENLSPLGKTIYQSKVKGRIQLGGDKVYTCNIICALYKYICVCVYMNAEVNFIYVRCM